MPRFSRLPALVFLAAGLGRADWVQTNSPGWGGTVYSLAVSDSMLFAGTDGDGVWKCPMSEMVPVSIRPGRYGRKSGFLDIASTLRSGRSITFNLSQRSAVKLSFFDVRGKETPILHGPVDKGEHAAILNPDLPQGLYFLRLQAGSEHRVKRVMLGK